jgi:hypothetical protein
MKEQVIKRDHTPHRCLSRITPQWISTFIYIHTKVCRSETTMWESCNQWNLTTMQEISSELFLLSASSVRRFAADRASLISLIASTASWFDITCNNRHEYKIKHMFVRKREEKLSTRFVQLNESIMWCFHHFIKSYIPSITHHWLI